MSEGIEMEPLRSPLRDSSGGVNVNPRVFTSPAVSIATFLFAAAQNEVGMVQNLLDEETVKVNDCDYDKRTALHVAASEGHLEVVRILVREGADVNFADRYNSTPLDDAIHHGHQDVAKLLIESGAKHGLGSNFGLDLVHAAGNGDLRTVMKLIEAGIPVSSSDYDLRTPLHTAIAGRHEQVVKYLLDHGADLSVEDRYGGTPLEEAHRAGVRLGEDPILNLIMEASGQEDRVPWRVSFTNPFVLTFFTIEIVIGILYGLFSEYGHGAASGETLDTGLPDTTQRDPFYMDVHVMIFIGFGFLMTFLRKYGYTAVGMTFILGSICIQVYQLFSTFWQDVLYNEWNMVQITLEKMIQADFAAGAVLISFGALLGKVTFTQMMILAIFEVFFYSLNEAISLKMQIADIGGSMVIHVFGAFFGLAASKVLTPKSARGNRDNSAVYHADIFSMIGTIFLWLFWPSFNGALSEGNNQTRAIINTVLSLTASCIFAFMFSQFWRRDKLFNMVDIQNATLAGGVAMGASADMAIHPGFALLVGAAAGTVSVFGFAVLQGWVENHIGLHDTCGVLNLHGIPGLIGGFVSAITTASFGQGHDYDPAQLTRIYSAAPGRSQSTQAKLQVAFLFITLGIAIGTGFLCATMLSRLAYPKKFFLDSTSFETPSREVPYFFDKRGEARHSSEKSSSAPTVIPGIAASPAGGGYNPDSDRLLREMENKINYLENSLKSQRKTLREQARVIEGITGQRPSLSRTMTEEESLALLASPQGQGPSAILRSGPTQPSFYSGPVSGIPPGPSSSSQQNNNNNSNLTAMLENLTRQQKDRDRQTEEHSRLLHTISQKLDQKFKEF